MSLARRQVSALLIASLFIAGCAAPKRAPSEIEGHSSIWRGRLAVRVDADPPHTEAQSVSASFELIGRPDQGELTLYTPLGSTAAALSWSVHRAQMRTPHETRDFESLESLIHAATGTSIPVHALFSWLGGDPMNVEGWQADLSQFADGRISAQRLSPPPGAQLRIILDR